MSEMIYTLRYARNRGKLMSNVMEISNNFMAICSEEMMKPVSRLTHVVMDSGFELPKTYVELGVNDMEYITGSFSSQTEVGRYAYGSSNYHGGVTYLLNQAGYHGKIDLYYSVAGVLLEIGSYASGPVGVVFAVGSIACDIMSFYNSTMQRDARERAVDASHYMDQRKNYGVTNNYTLFGALHNGYGVFTW